MSLRSKYRKTKSSQTCSCNRVSQREGK